MNAYSVGSHPCNCTKAHHDPQLIAVTGGPGAGMRFDFKREG